MKYRRFEEVPVWNAAVDLATQAFSLSAGLGLERLKNLRDQLERAALSVSNNIAEGFTRGTNAELISFLYITRGSAGEVRSMLCVLERLRPELSNGSELESLRTLSLDIARQLNAWIKALKDTTEQDPRSRTTAGQEAESRTQRRKDFERYLDQVRRGEITEFPPPECTTP